MRHASFAQPWKLPAVSGHAIFLGKNLLGQRDDYRFDPAPQFDASVLTDVELDVLIDLLAKALVRAR